MDPPHSGSLAGLSRRLKLSLRRRRDAAASKRGLVTADAHAALLRELSAAQETAARASAAEAAAVASAAEARREVVLLRAAAAAAADEAREQASLHASAAAPPAFARLLTARAWTAALDALLRCGEWLRRRAHAQRLAAGLVWLFLPPRGAQSEGCEDVFLEDEGEAFDSSAASAEQAPARLSADFRRRSLDIVRRAAAAAGAGGTPPSGVLPQELWRDGDATRFRVRGVTYLSDRVKFPSAPAALRLLAAELFEPAAPTEHLAAHPASWLAQARARDSANSNFRLLVVFNNPRGAGPGRPFTTLALTFGADCSLAQLLARETPLAAALRRFLGADTATRKGMFKCIAAVHAGPGLLRAACPRTPVLLGKHLRLASHAPPDASYLELDLDVGSSAVGDRFFRHLFARCVARVTLELAFLLEGSRPGELPEQCLAAAWVCNVAPELAIPLPPLDG